jgi:hypothetical protein
MESGVGLYDWVGYSRAYLGTKSRSIVCTWVDLSHDGEVEFDPESRRSLCGLFRFYCVRSDYCFSVIFRIPIASQRQNGLKAS